ncbi:MAG: hypothetical protein LBV77_00875 [Candidatus Adiutrix intracellularis]|nr:hypothetical protein [Candidatus Adiutrix intracellularis]
MAAKEAVKELVRADIKNAFELLVRKYIRNRRKENKTIYTKNILAKLEKDVSQITEGVNVTERTAPQLLTTLRRIKERNAMNTARRCMIYCS